MNMIQKSAAALGLGGLVLVATLGMGARPAPATTPARAADGYTVDPVHSNDLFRIHHAGVGMFWGRFNEVHGTFLIDDQNPDASFFRITVPIASVDTHNDKRDQHLKSGDFFNARQYPEAKFESTAFKPTGQENEYEVTGDLTMFGQTRPITARVLMTGQGSVQGKDAQGFEVEFTVKRSDFGNTTFLAPDGGDGGGLGNEVRVIFAGEGGAA
jgi:polyisoprenoid-binding protein YceI